MQNPVSESYRKTWRYIMFNQFRSYITALALIFATTPTVAEQLTILGFTFDVMRVASGDRVGHSFYVASEVREDQAIDTVSDPSDCTYRFTFNYLDSKTREVLLSKPIELQSGESDDTTLLVPSLLGDAVRTILVTVKSSTVIGTCTLFVAPRQANANGLSVGPSTAQKIVGPAWKDVADAVRNPRPRRLRLVSAK